MKQLFKHPLFISGFSFLLLLFLASVIHSIFFNGVVPETKYLYEDGVIIEKGPFSPLEVPPLGTGPIGKEMFYMLLQGAKYTIGIAVVVAACRILVSSVIASLFNHFLFRFSQYISGLVNAFYYIPTALICLVILLDIIKFGPSEPDPYSFYQKALFEIIILIAVAVPLTTLLLANQVNQIYKYEFINAAKTLGGKRWHVFWKHALPHMWPRLLIQFTQEIVQVLVLLIHLGFFHLLFGGTLELKDDDETIPDIYVSMSSEWSGIVGNGFESLNSWPWYFFVPMVAFTFIILAFNFMTKGMEDVFFSFQITRKKTSKKPDKRSRITENTKFEFLHREVK